MAPLWRWKRQFATAPTSCRRDRPALGARCHRRRPARQIRWLRTAAKRLKEK
jgi:hypothetical protein